MPIKFFDDLFKKAQARMQPSEQRIETVCLDKLCLSREEKVAARLSEQGENDRFSWYICFSMKSRPWEWSVNEQRATHKSGVVVHVSGDRNNLDRSYDTVGSLRGNVMNPSFVCVSDDSQKEIAQAFNLLSKTKILSLLRADTFEEGT